MKFTVDSVGKIRHAEIQLDGITVIVGANDSGKSTLGKSLYALINSGFDVKTRTFSTVANKLTSKALDTNSGVQISSFIYARSTLFNQMATALLGKQNTVRSIGKWLRDFAETIKSKNNISQDPKAYDVARLSEYLGGRSKSAKEFRNQAVKVLEDTITIYRRSFATAELRGIFHHQINSRFKTAYPIATIGFDYQDVSDMHRKVSIKSDKCISAEDTTDSTYYSIFVDSPQTLVDIFSNKDDKRMAFYEMLNPEFMRYDLGTVESRSLGTIAKIVTGPDYRTEVEKENIETTSSRIVDELSKGFSSDLEKSPTGGFVLSDNDEELLEHIDVRNSSMGGMAFLILKKLLSDSYIADKSVLILDEPEIHLHPAWQIIYAKAVVEIAQDLGAKILVTTHSPYFMKALKVYGEQSKITQQMHMYTSDSDSDGLVVFHEALEAEQDELYDQMIVPFDELESISVVGELGL